MDLSSRKYILYKYQPVLPNYFDQVDIIELTDVPPDDIDSNYILELACQKNYCTPDEITIIGIFDDKQSLENYLVTHDLRYLA